VKITDVSNGNSDNIFLSFADGLKPNKMSITQLRKVDGFSNISEEAGLKLIDELYKLSVITYGLFKTKY
jgi:hypothetical protein